MVCRNCFVKSTVKARDFKIEFRIQTGFSSLLDCCCFDLILSIIFLAAYKKMEFSSSDGLPSSCRQRYMPGQRLPTTQIPDEASRRAKASGMHFQDSYSYIILIGENMHDLFTIPPLPIYFFVGGRQNEASKVDHTEMLTEGKSHLSLL